MEFRSRNRIVVILGPTSSGKSDIAIRLAKKFNGEIISADSRQIYKGLDIGTGKIHGTWNMEHGTFVSEKISHYLIDIVSPRTEYNVSRFKNDAEKIIQDILRRGKLPIICGGTGFWIKALVDNVNFPEVKPDKKLRKKLEKYSDEKLFRMLQKLDLKRAKNIDAKNKVRLIRAIEIAKTLGYIPKIMEHGTRNIEHDFLQIGIAIDKKDLHQNIKKRLEKRFGEGMIAEIEKLKRQGLSWKKIQSFGLGYYWIPLYLKNKLTTNFCYGKNLLSIEKKKDLFEKIYQSEKDYAKRQMTWFRKDKRIKWLKNYREIEKEVGDLFAGGNSVVPALIVLRRKSG